MESVTLHVSRGILLLYISIPRYKKQQKHVLVAMLIPLMKSSSPGVSSDEFASAYLCEDCTGSWIWM
jgi:hypothetical protein